MKRLRVVFRPDDRETSVHEGMTLLEAARQAGIMLATPCGGRGTCGKCAVQIHPGGRPVLACQHLVESDLVVTVPPESRFYAHKILDFGLTAGEQVKPDVYQAYRGSTGRTGIYGLAIDIGTTTVVAKLVDMTTGRCVATRAMLNPQTRFGDDVVSRIGHAQPNGRAMELHEAIIACTNDLVHALCRQGGIETADIYEACIVGNTTMNHFFLHLPVAQLGHAPYRPYSVEAHDLRPEQLGIAINAAGNVHCVENIAGFVGADTTAVALAVDMDSVTDRVLVVDIGTNGELLLGTPEKLYAASCAAGPALEGARIRQGSRAVDGAIEAVTFNGDLAVDVIGGAAARSICGSGLVDAVAAMLDAGIVDTTGRFTDATSLPEALAGRVATLEGQPAFRLTTGTPDQPPVVLTQRDIRELQLAKGAIRAGIRVLLDKLGMTDADIDRVLLAGAFGNYIRPRSAVHVGLLPRVPLERIQSVGNAAVVGAQMLLLSRGVRERAAQLARRIEYVEIAHTKNFADTFAEAMALRP